MKTRIEIDLSNKLADISPFIYGNFIEFIQDCINKGIWAELLMNRGFENEDINGDGVSDPWYPVGFNDAYVYSMDSEKSYNSKYSQKLQTINHYGGFRGIAQQGLKFFKNELYRGYIWTKAKDFEGIVRVIAKSQDNKFYFEKQFKVTDRWSKYEFEFNASSNEDNAVFEIHMVGEGCIWLDQVSLMPESAVDGVWKEVITATKELNAGIMRFPGGCFADCYHWEDGIGPRDERPTKLNEHWKGNEENNFGTDEFIKFCKNVSCQAMICVNFGSGTPEEAANWVEYCNGSIDTVYGALRAKNGNPEPYNVKYWDIGNEMFADWEIGNCTADEFAKKYIQFYDAMKEKDNSIKILACGGNGNELSQEWNRTLLNNSDGKIDHISLHCYAPQIGNMAMDNEKLYYGTVGAVQKYEQLIERTRHSISECVKDPDNVNIAVTEWNTMFNNYSYREHTLEAAIFNAGMLNLFIRNSDIIKICNYSDLVNGWQGGCIRCDRGSVYVTPSYYAIKLFSNSGAKQMVKVEWESESYNIDNVGHVKEINNVKYVDVSACLGENELVVFIVNRHLEKCAVANINILGGQVSEYFGISEISSNNPYDINTEEKELVKIKDSVIYNENCDNGVLIHPCSVCRIKIPLI
jgi:alpha-N-arabinofuranosidase